MVASSGSLLQVATVTFANGGDNIGIYFLLFAALSMAEKLLMVSIFLCMIWLWCLAGRYSSKHPAVAKLVDRYGYLMMSVAQVPLGLYILYENESAEIFE